MNQSLPNDPIILLSVINTKLRDRYKDIDELCQDLSVDKDDLFAKLNNIDYVYDYKCNQFV